MRQRVHAPAFASFDGVSGGMILDLSEGGLSMQMGGGFDGYLPGEPVLDRRSSEHQLNSRRDEHPLAPGRRVRMELELANAPAQMAESRLLTTGYIAWADALGRAGVRFSELPQQSRERLNEWMAVHGGEPSNTAPKLALDWPRSASAGARFGGERFTINLEPEADDETQSEDSRPAISSATVQYEFSSLGDLTSALRLIGERARALTRGTSAAIALASKGAVMCRASVGESAPALGARLDVNSGLAGECFRAGKALRCDDVENDPRVDLESCRRLGVRSIVAAPVRYERDTVGLLMVLAKDPFNFDEGDVAVVESLAHTVVRSMRQAELERGLAAG